MGRVESREEAFKLVFEYVMNNERNEEFLAEVLENKKIEESYITKLYESVTTNYNEIIKELEEKAYGYTVSRMFKVDLALIVLALAEIKYMEDIPTAVSINEVLNLAKKYSTEKSASFINGVLSKLVK